MTSIQHFFSGRIRLVGLFAALLLVCTGCFDIKEEITLQKNGSGTYVMSVDMTGLMSMMESMGGGATEGVPDPMHAMDSTMEVQAEAMRGLKGVSKVSHKREGYVITYSYDFENFDALNEASELNNAGGGMGTESFTQGVKYNWTSKSFERVTPDIQALLGEQDEETKSAMDMMKMFLGEAKFTLIYHLPGPAKKVSSKTAQISGDKRTVTQEMKLLDMMEGNESGDLKISFKAR
ncbi:MAG: hypothetical protein EAZ89_17345 [Bacteroidetes bacterium]|nr:MAG: hypothetical protein EAZ89_17345 [Bacteroidota bacterium]